MGLPSLEILEVSWTSFSASLANQPGFEQELEQRPPQLPSYLYGPVTQGSVFTAQVFFVAPLQPPLTSHPHFPLSKCCSTSSCSLGAPSAPASLLLGRCWSHLTQCCSLERCSAVLWAVQEAAASLRCTRFMGSSVLHSARSTVLFCSSLQHSW